MKIEPLLEDRGWEVERGWAVKKKGSDVAMFKKWFNGFGLKAVVVDDQIGFRFWGYGCNLDCSFLSSMRKSLQELESSWLMTFPDLVVGS